MPSSRPQSSPLSDPIPHAPAQGVFTPKTRRWTVAIYMVADGPSGNEALDKVALDELDDIYAAAKDHSDLYVAVQVDLSDQNGLIRFAVGGALQRVAEADAAAEKTLEGFFKWMAETCPAEEYVIVFWGHSSGPVGLFGDRATLDGPITRLTLPKLNGVMRTFVAGLAHAQEKLLTARESCPRSRDLEAAYASHRPRARRRPADAGKPAPKAEKQAAIVLFKNCWMSTIETAFELEPYAEYMIASQAKVPQVGWPYEEMFSALATTHPLNVGRAAAQLRDELHRFYQLSRNRVEGDEVPYSLLDLGAVDGIKPPYRRLLEELRAVQTLQGGAKAVNDALERATIGDPALADMKGWLRQLQEKVTGVKGVSASVGSAVAALDTEIDKLVVWKTVDAFPDHAKSESATSPVRTGNGADGGRPYSAFGGVSVFHYPEQQRDFEESLIAPAIAADSSLYTSLAFEAEIRWSTVAVNLYAGATPPALPPRPRHLPARLQFLLRTPTQLTRQDRLDEMVTLLRSIHGGALADEDKPVRFDKRAEFAKVLEFANALFFRDDKPVRFDKPVEFAKALFFGEKALELAKTLAIAREVGGGDGTTFGTR